ncbi:MAG: hypothetical protein WBA97_26565 [Actinophytocola sp.]|uniref:hypothetical protein n=1 Tax=Actinophytocola sp. TaxID=1872138 RepID=UPI003C7643B3
MGAPLRANLEKTEAHCMRIAKFFVVGGSAAVLIAGAAIPAAAQPTDTTNVTFEVLAGTLDIVTPEAADLGEGAPGEDIAGPLGPVTVDDTRSSVDASWEATVTATAFQTGGGSDPETITPEEIDYWSGPATGSVGNGTLTPGQDDAAAAAPLSATVPLVAFTHVGGTGNNTATWEPGLIVHLRPENIAGVYNGTVTHSVA